MLTASDAQQRAALLEVREYRVDLDLDRGPREFGSWVRIEVSCRRPGADSFLDLRALRLHRARLNGRELDVSTCREGRLPLVDLAAENVLEVEATMAYRQDGQGLHRFTDPVDGADYVYGMSFLDAAPTVFACFDQPDLKAPYEVTVTAPADWTVLGNGAATRLRPGRWRLSRTPPLPTYTVVVCAGPYAQVGAQHRGLPLRWLARASLEPRLAGVADELLRVTRLGLDYYEDLFGIDYPYDSYDQIVVPEFNAGAMENPGCVTYAETALPAGATTPAQRRARALTILHEMAHMWFGNLVTLRWWDDLWLNESFAEYLAHRALAAATDIPGAGADFGITRKAWGYAAERRPSTHPVAAQPAPDAHAALGNFDGISYAKGAAVLRQLAAYLGDDAFRAGVSRHLRRHAYGNADLGDFLTSMRTATHAADADAEGADLDRWQAAWLRTCGRDTLAVEATVDEAGGSTGGSAGVGRSTGPGGTAGLGDSTGSAGSGRPGESAGGPRGAAGQASRIASAVLHCRPPADTGPEAVRTHRLDLAGYTDGRLDWREELTITGPRTFLPQLEGRVRPALLLPNAGDLTWAGVELDATGLAALPAELPALTDVTARVVAWLAVSEAVIEGRAEPQLLFDVVGAALPTETETAIIAYLARTLSGTVLPCYAPDPTAARHQLTRAGLALLSAVSDVGEGLAVADLVSNVAEEPASGPGAGAVGDGPAASGAGAARIPRDAAGRAGGGEVDGRGGAAPTSADGGPGSAAAGPALDGRYLAALRFVVAVTDETDLLRDWLDGRGAAAPFAGDEDLAQACLVALARLGAVDAEEIEQRRRARPSLEADLTALTARAALPTAAAKAWAWRELFGTSGRSNAERLHLASGFWRGGEQPATAALLADYLPRYVEEVAGLDGCLDGMALGKVAAAAFPAPMVDGPTEQLVADRLARGGLPAEVTRALADGLADLRWAWASRSRYARARTGPDQPQ